MIETLTEKKETFQKMTELFKIEELEERMEFDGWSYKIYADNDYQAVRAEYTWSW